MRTNLKLSQPVYTFEGARAVPPRNPLHELRRAVSACMLWEDQFYEDGVSISDRIAGLVAQCDPKAVAALAVEARRDMNLRHVPLQLAVALAKVGQANALGLDGYDAILKRADEPGEMVSLYWKDGRKPLPAAMKRGIAKALGKFDAYQLGKYNRDRAAVKLRDLLRLVHPKPANDEQAALWQAVIADTLPAPDTWEVALSGGADKRETFTRLLQEGGLGYLALLRNLRGMAEAGVDPDLVRSAILARKGARDVLPFRYVAAARAAPQFEPALDEALCAAVEGLPILPGKTLVLVDVSVSMNDRLSAKSDMTRMDAAAALASVIYGDLRVFSFSNALVEVPPRRGMAGVDAVRRSQPHGGTYLGQAVARLNQEPHDRLIVITDEQSHDTVPEPVAKRAYMVNVASARNGVGYGAWTRIGGWSEHVLRFIAETEAR